MSTTIRSHQETAQTYATQLATACQTLTGISAASQDTQTTLQGNDRAHHVMTEAQTLATNISSAVSTTASNLHSVASEFEAVDQAGAGRFRS